MKDFANLNTFGKADIDLKHILFKRDCKLINTFFF